jgi:hypothetical protein
MRFSLDTRPASAHRAERWLVVAMPAGALAFPLLERALIPLVGGVWSVVVAITVIGSPLSGLLRMVTAGRTPRQAALEGLGLGVGMAMVYVWVFGAPWVAPPGF